MVSTHVEQVQLVLGVQLGLDDRLLVLVGNMVFIHILELEMEDVGLVLVCELVLLHGIICLV